MHCAPFLLTMQIIFASVSYRRVVADLRIIRNPDDSYEGFVIYKENIPFFKLNLDIVKIVSILL